MSPSDKTLIEEAFAARQAGRLNEAEALVKSLLAIKPHLTEAKMALGIVVMESGRPAEAAESFKHVLSDDPSNFSALNWLAVILTDLGRPDEALPHATRALQMRQRDLGAVVSMGRTLYSLGRYGDSIACFDRAIAMAPNDASNHQFRGFALEKMYRDDEALASFRQAVRLSPTPDRLVPLAESEMAVGNFDEARKTAQKAVDQDPKLTGAQTIVARCLTEMGKDDEAETYWQAAFSLAEDPTPIRLTRSYAWLAAGKFESAADELRRVISENPKLPDAYFSLIMAKRMTEADRPLLDSVIELIAGDELTDEGRMLAHYAAGKAYDNLGEYESAICAYNVANRLKRRLAFNDAPFDRADFEAQVTVRSRVFTPKLFAETSKLGSSSELPVLVVGMMRSGTTLLEQILTSHPDIGGAGEQSFWMKEQARLIDLATGKVAFDRIRPASEEYIELLNQLSPDCKRVVDKNPANVVLVGMIHMALPSARFILTKRHPVDTALSMWMTPVRTTAPFFADRRAIVFAYQQYLRAVENLREALPSDRFLEVDYEQMVADRETQVRRMLEFLEVEWNEACLRPEKNARSVRTPSYWQVRQPVYTSSVGKWKRYEPWLGVFRELMPASD